MGLDSHGSARPTVEPIVSTSARLAATPATTMPAGSSGRRAKSVTAAWQAAPKVMWVVRRIGYVVRRRGGEG